eukprot:2910341-Amphidinium_carterae.2
MKYIRWIDGFTPVDSSHGYNVVQGSAAISRDLFCAFDLAIVQSDPLAVNWTTPVQLLATVQEECDTRIG